MARRGRDAETNKARGLQASKVTAIASVSFLPDESAQDWSTPGWLGGEAGALYERRVKKYHRRAQNIDGMQEQLAQYCRLECEIIKRYQIEVPPMAWLAQHLKYSVEFYDTPASRKLPVTGKKADNRFGKHKRD